MRADWCLQQMYPQPTYQQLMAAPQQQLQHVWGLQPQTPQQTMMQPPSLQQQHHALAASSPQMPYGFHQQHALSPQQPPAQAPAPVAAAPPAPPPPPPPARLHPPAPPPPPIGAAESSERQHDDAGGKHLQPHERLFHLPVVSHLVLKWNIQKITLNLHLRLLRYNGGDSKRIENGWTKKGRSKAKRHCTRFTRQSTGRNHLRVRSHPSV